jgi:flagellar FliJ protein
VTSPRFKFGLERVRDVRAHDEDRAKEAFAASLAQRARGAALLAAAGEQVHAAHATLRSGAAGSGHDFQGMQLWLERVERSRREAEHELARRDAELLQRRGALTEASRKRQALDRLKERRAAEHRLETNRAEGAFLDEIALTQHARRGS